MINFLFTKTPLVFLAQSFWRDEAFTYLLARRNIFQIIVLTVKDFNPPFYYFFLHFWMKIFGENEITLRLPSLIFYWGTVYVAHHFIQDILKIKGKKSWIYLLFFILNPLLVYYAFEARMYSMLAFFATASFYFFHQRNKKSYLIVTILGLYTHYFMILALAVQVIYLAVHEVADRKNFQGLRLIIYSLLAFFPWLLFFLVNKTNSFSFWISSLPFREIADIPTLILSGYEKGFWFLTSPNNRYLLYLIIFNWILIILITLGLIKTDWRKINERKTVVFFLLWGLIPPIIVFLISLYFPLFLPRYLIFSSVGLSLLLIYCLEKIKIIPRIIFFILIMVFFITYQGLQVKYRRKVDFAKSIAEIKFLAKPTDLLYVRSELDFHIADYYFDEKRVYIFNKSYAEIPNYVGKILIPKDKIINYYPLFPKKAFLLNPDSTFEIVSVN